MNVFGMKERKQRDVDLPTVDEYYKLKSTLIPSIASFLLISIL
jgi:hypothetical protein